MQDALGYDEPPSWYYPVRENLGAELLASKQPALAEAVYRADLKRNPENPRSLFGLAQSLRAQGKTPEAAKVEERFTKAWAHADVTLAPDCLAAQ
jgi:Tfp pilus assembly protein PilF